jgi:hypothetical protein
MRCESLQHSCFVSPPPPPSKGTPGLDVNLRAGGLGLSGTVVVWWNGAKAYEGAASAIELGEGAERRR